MTKLQQALEKIAALPQAAQDDIAEQLLRQVKRVQRLRAEILKGLESFDRGRYTDIPSLMHKKLLSKHAPRTWRIGSNLD
jgi:predicted transcriptional regulator